MSDSRTSASSLVSRTASDYAAFRATLAQRFQDLRDRAPAMAESYRTATPYPHIVIDDFLPPDIADALHDEFPGRDDPAWAQLRTEDQKLKFATQHERDLPDGLRLLTQELNSGAFLEVLEQITGIGDLIADTKLVGGGLHRIERGGKLGVHIDFSHHPSNRLCRRLNLLLYLNKDWHDSYGGHFELWSPGLERAERRIAPVFNRCVVFSTSDHSWHGHPEPLTAPEGRARQSVALYYFTRERVDEPELEHNTLFRSRPGDPFNLKNSLVRAASSSTVRDLTPPQLYRWLRARWNKT